MPVDGKNAPILSGEAVEAIQAALDDHIIKAQSMRGNPFTEFMSKEVEQWEELLMRTSDNLEMWLNVQAVWMALEPVFTSEDIIRQMAKEGNLFNQVNKSWEKLMKRTTDSPQALTVTAYDDLGDILKEAQKKLDLVQKGLSDYLETKRGFFPRFFFLSDEELLEILSETKEPKKVQPHLKKCFEGIAKLEFDTEKKIHAMYSIEGEKIDYIKVIDPMAAKGKVEEWLEQVEKTMLASVKKVVEEAYTDYQKTPRDQWILKWAGQAVLVISQLYWTHTTEECM